MIYLVVGLIGAILMFSGDMLLYYDPNDFNYKAGDGQEIKMKAIKEVMGKVSTKRLMVGGMLGPISAFLYCVGFYHILFICNEQTLLIGKIAFFLLCFGIIIGGAYHSHCVYLGLLAKDQYEESLVIVGNYFQKMVFLLYIAEALGFGIHAGIIVTGNSLLPRWMFLFTPIVLFLLKPIVARLPKGIKVIISGGWSNLISVIYYALAIFCLL